jgi:SAM-dependent methyltransferase
MSTAAECALSSYEFKPGSYSSHGLLLASMPERGEGRRVLDVGCGPGYLSALLAARGYEVVGIDGRIGADRGPEHVEFIQADLDQGLPPLDGRFDFILCADILEHLRAPQLLLRQLRASLARDGRLLASLPNSGHAYFRWTVLRGQFPALDRGLFDRTHLHFYTWEGWRELLAASGFSIETVKCSAVPFRLVFPRWSETALVSALETLSHESARWWKTLFAYQFVVSARPERNP